MNRSGNLVPGLVFRTIQFWFGVPEPVLELELAVSYPWNWLPVQHWFEPTTGQIQHDESFA
jgi:hypothetical protein